MFYLIIPFIFAARSILGETLAGAEAKALNSWVAGFSSTLLLWRV